MNDATQSMDADFAVVPASFTREGERKFFRTGARRGLLPEAPSATAGKLLMALLAVCGICRAPRITSAECVSNATRPLVTMPARRMGASRASNAFRTRPARRRNRGIGAEAGFARRQAAISPRNCSRARFSGGQAL